jgi:hypothetical protein
VASHRAECGARSREAFPKSLREALNRHLRCTDIFTGGGRKTQFEGARLCRKPRVFFLRFQNLAFSPTGPRSRRGRATARSWLLSPCLPELVCSPRWSPSFSAFRGIGFSVTADDPSVATAFHYDRWRLGPLNASTRADQSRSCRRGFISTYCCFRSQSSDTSPPPWRSSRPASSSSSSTVRTMAGEAPDIRTRSSIESGAGPSSPVI